MRFRHAMLVMYITLPICALLRLIQMVFTIDRTTGFIKQPYTVISTIITVIIFAGIIAVAFLAASTDGINPKAIKHRPIAAAASMLVGGMFVYQTVSDIASFKSTSWVDTLSMLLGLLSAGVFIAYGVKNVYKYNMPSMTMLIPTLFYVFKLINLFINASKLALVTENVFLIFTNSIVLLFMFELASFENDIGEAEKHHKKLFAYGVATVMMCATTSLPKLILMLFSSQSFVHNDIAETLLNLSIAIFVYVYLSYSYGEKIFKFKKSAPKHLDS